MTEEKQQTQGAEQGTYQHQTDAAWKDVGEQFKNLGESIADAFSSLWEDESTRQHVKDLESGLESMVDSLGDAINKAAHSEEAQKIRSEADKMARSAREAGQKAYNETRPKLIQALQKVNEEIQNLIGNLEREPGAEAPETPEQPAE
ncbi:MAG: hypothetical protein JW981_03380 [Anaerolineae bacterium]|nr:hypothetical protein [Anaerolineae bacterium]